MEINRIKLAKEKLPKFKNLEKKRYEVLLNKEEIENNFRIKNGIYEQIIPEINYRLVEENAPSVIKF